MITFAVRAGLALLGLWCGWYGLRLLFHHNLSDLREVALWCACGILAHDVVFAPLCAAIGVGARRVLPRRWWAPIACGAVCTVALFTLSAPVLFRGHARADNPTVLDRNYPLGLLIALTVVWVLVIVGSIAARRAAPPRGHGENLPG